MPEVMGQSVPKVKAILSRDQTGYRGHNVLMDQDDFELADSEFRTELQAQLREIQGNRTDAQMAELLGVGADRYKKWKNRPGSQFPMFLLPRLASIGVISVEKLILETRDRAISKASKRKKFRISS